MTNQSVGPAERQYRKLEHRREPYLKRAREASKLTIPSLIPPQHMSPTTVLPTPWQGVGARGVNNLASKLLLALLPPNSPFFRLKVDEFTLTQAQQQSDFMTQVELGLSKIERTVMDDIEVSADRVSIFEALKHLLVAGNVLLYDAPDRGLRVFHLSRYVIRRDPMGNVMEIITHENVDPSVLPKEIRTTVTPGQDDIQKHMSLYTHVKRMGNHWKVYQEVKGMLIPGSEGTYPLDKSPFIPLRFARIDGEDYGRGFVEEYIGDLKSLEGLSQALVEGSAAAAKVLFLIDPNGTTRAKTLAESPNGAIREGSSKDVSVLQVEKFADFRVALEQSARIEERLNFAFLLNSAVQRKAERVTAEEIRFMAQELEDTLGGVYSILTQEFQLPYVNRKMAKMQKARKLPSLPKGVVRPMIVTGLEALGRGHDLNKLDIFIGGLAQQLGPQILAQYMNLDDYIARRATALGVDTKGLIKTKEEIAAEQQQLQLQALANQFGPEILKQGGQLVKEGIKIDGQNTQ